MVIISEAYTQLEDLETSPIKTETSKPNVSEGKLMELIYMYIYMYLCIYIYIHTPGPSKGCQMVPKGCQSTIPLCLIGTPWEVLA